MNDLLGNGAGELRSMVGKERAIDLPVCARDGVERSLNEEPVAQTLNRFEVGERRWTLLVTLKDDDLVAVHSIRCGGGFIGQFARMNPIG